MLIIQYLNNSFSGTVVLKRELSRPAFSAIVFIKLLSLLTPIALALNQLL